MKKWYLFLILASTLLIPSKVIRVGVAEGDVIFPVQTASAQSLIQTKALAVSRESLSTWLDLLAKYENCPPEGIIDRNGQRSYGAYCFQMATFIRYSNKYQTFGLITDNNFQRTLAEKMVRDGGWANWYTTVKQKIGLPPI